MEDTISNQDRIEMGNVLCSQKWKCCTKYMKQQLSRDWIPGNDSWETEHIRQTLRYGKTDDTSTMMVSASR